MGEDTNIRKKYDKLKALRAIPWQMRWKGYIALACIALMVLFNYLARVNPGSAVEYKGYAAYAFDILKIDVGMVIGFLGGRIKMNGNGG